MSLDQITRRFGWGALRALYATPAAGSTAIPDVAASPSAPSAAPAADTSAASPENATAGSTRKDGLKSTFATLFSAIRTGDMSTAKAALADLPTEAATYSPKPSANGRNSAREQAGADLQSFLTAVANGDKAGAQSALAALQADFTAMSARRRHGRHHHHRESGDDGAAASPASAPATPVMGTVQSSIVVTSFTLTISVQSVRAYSAASLPAGTSSPTGQSLSATA